MALPLVHAARHNDVKPLMGRELMILTHDDDDVCMYTGMRPHTHMFTFVLLETRHVLTLRMFLLRFVHLRTPHV